jgi:hypothetical protein
MTDTTLAVSISASGEVLKSQQAAAHIRAINPSVAASRAAGAGAASIVGAAVAMGADT